MSRNDGLTMWARKPLIVFDEHGDWMTRIELAHLLGKARLTPYTVRRLQTIVSRL